VNRNFFQEVYRLLALIPPGRVVTYGDLATLAGKPGAARAAGWALQACPEGLPWYRVVNAQGRPSVTARTPDGKLLQRVLLEEEGVAFDESGRLDLDRYTWEGPGRE